MGNMSDTDSTTANLILVVAAVVLILLVGGFSLLFGLIKIALIGIAAVLVLGAIGWKLIHSRGD